MLPTCNVHATLINASSFIHVRLNCAHSTTAHITVLSIHMQADSYSDQWSGKLLRALSTLADAGVTQLASMGIPCRYTRGLADGGVVLLKEGFIPPAQYVFLVTLSPLSMSNRGR